MKTEEETEHRERNKEEETHPRGKETAETAAAQGSVITGTKKKHILRPLAQNPRKKKEKLKEGQLPLTQGVETLQETDVEVVREVTHTLRFILPCKSECQPIYQN